MGNADSPILLRRPSRTRAVVVRMDVPIVLDPQQLRRDALSGKVSVEALLDIIDRLRQSLQRSQADNQRFRQRLAQYEPAAAGDNQASNANSANAATPNTSFSLDAEDKRRQTRRRRQKSPGRKPTKEKFAAAERKVDIFPDGIPKRQCQLVRERAVWRIEDGKAIRVGYRIHAGPDGKEPRIPGVTPRCEYGVEILVVLAFLVYLIGISLDKACAVMEFFCQLPLRKSQADALLRQLATHWDEEYETLCTLLAHAAIVYMDETGWKIGTESCSLWVFASQLQRVFLFGCHKDDATLDKMLPPEIFTGIGVSDDAAVYQDRFVQGQKCWAHLLRKAIKLALLYPNKKKYQCFLDDLLQIYRDGKRAAADGRLGETGRKQRVDDLSSRLLDVCVKNQQATTPEMTPHERDFANLVEELQRLLLAEELFTFVLVPEVEATNNLSERTLRGSAQDRKANRTNKTATGAQRRSVIVSVLESLRINLEHFSLATVVSEVTRWMNDGVSLFAEQWHAIEAQQTAPQPNSG